MITVIKTVQFDLTTNNDSGIITMPDLLDKSYVRAHISKLFCELEKNGLGQHVVGTRGRGQCEHFIKNEKTPDNFILQMSEKSRGRPRKDQVAEVAEVAEIVTTPMPVIEMNIPVVDTSSITSVLAGIVSGLADDVAEIAANAENEEIALEAQMEAGQVADIDIVQNIDAADAVEVKAPAKKKSSRTRKSSKKSVENNK